MSILLRFDLISSDKPKCTIPISLFDTFSIGDWALISTSTHQYIAPLFPNPDSKKSILYSSQSISIIMKNDTIQSGWCKFEKISSENIPIASIIVLETETERLLNSSTLDDISIQFNSSIISPKFNLSTLKYSIMIDSMIPYTQNTFCKITTNTKFIFKEKQSIESIPLSFDYMNMKDIPCLTGMEDIMKQISDLIVYPIRFNSILSRLNIDLPNTILLSGPPGKSNNNRFHQGVGKTMLIKHIAYHTGSKLISINGPEIMKSELGETEKSLNILFKSAKQSSNTQPTLLFMDEIDSITRKRNTFSTLFETRIVSQLLVLLDGIMKSKSRFPLLIIGVTNQPDLMDSALRRPGRFDREIVIDPPNLEQRKLLLRYFIEPISHLYDIDNPVADNTITEKHITDSTLIDNTIDSTINDTNSTGINNMNNMDDIDFDELAYKTVGYVASDIESICRQVLSNYIIPTLNPITNKSPLKLKTNQFNEIITNFVPCLKRHAYSLSLLKDTALNKWNEIGGYESVKKRLKQCIEYPIIHSKQFKRLGLNASKGILLYGPPGCSKTSLVKAISHSQSISFLQLNGASLYSPFVGDSEQSIFKVFRKARSCSPCILFIDEMDVVVGKRDFGSSDSNVSERVLSALLVEIDGISQLNDVLVVGATNRPDQIDPALMRPGRFDQVIYVGPPDYNERIDILSVKTKGIPLYKVDLSIIAAMTERYSGADLEGLCREAALCAIRESFQSDSVTMDHFLKALLVIKPSVSVEMMVQYEEFVQTYGGN